MFVLASNILHVCDMLHGSLTFDVSVPSPICVGDVAQYTCEVGYVLHVSSYSTQRTCQSSLVWDGEEPTCTKATCNTPYSQICYNCDIVDSTCAYDTTPAIFDDCRLAAISNTSVYVKHDSSNCNMFTCQPPPITYTNGSVLIFSSCNTG